MPIEIKNLSYRYMRGTSGERTALEDVSLNISDGEFWGIIGHTGSGKSTLLQLMGGIVPPEEGTVVVDGFDFSDRKQRTQGRKRVGLVFQYPEYQLFEETVARDIAYGPRNMKLPESEVDGRVREAMKLIGLDYGAFADKNPFELSGGEKRRAALGGIIAMRPRYLVLDEPMAGLDPAGRRSILETLDSLRRERGCAIVMVTHSMDDVARYSDRIAVMSKGRLVKAGTPDEIFGGGLPLEEMGLELPAAVRLGKMLRRRGMEVPQVYTVDGMAEYLLKRAKNA